jgi:diguanylate cyclase (GGDEF)-like protein
LALPHSQNPGTDEVTVSIGVAVLVPTPNQTPRALLDAADRALYQAKQSGRDTWRLYEPPPKVRLVKDDKGL